MVHVRSYVKRDGTHVRAHTRSTPGARSQKQRSGRSGSPEPVISPPLSSLDAAFIQAEKARILDGRKIKEAAEYCADIVASGAIEATADRVAKHVSTETEKKLFRKWRAFRCRWLNSLAKAILDAKRRYHDLTADLVVKLLSARLVHRSEQTFAKELVKKIPLPGDAKFVAVAQGLRITGVALCLAQGEELEKCACFKALALETGKDAAKKLLIAEGDTWMCYMYPDSRPT